MILVRANVKSPTFFGDGMCFVGHGVEVWLDRTTFFRQSVVRASTGGDIPVWKDLVDRLPWRADG